MKILLLASICLLAICCQVKKTVDTNCSCDTLRLRSYRPSPGYDSVQTDFYDLDSATNKQLWFADIENIDSTHYTKLWDAYHDCNFMTSQHEFKNHYQESKNTELAFQLGPTGILWAYHTFVLRKERCCYIFIRTIFAHARFRYKAYAFVSPAKVDSLFSYVKDLERTELGKEEPNYSTASFVDKRNEDVFDVSLEGDAATNSRPDSSIFRLLNFLDTKIKWNETYPLEVETPRPKIDEQTTVSGSYRIENQQGNFTGNITIEKREEEEYMYYQWAITSEDEKLLAAKSSSINFKKIPDDRDKFDFTRDYVLDEIKEYRIKNKKIITHIQN